MFFGARSILIWANYILRNRLRKSHPADVAGFLWKVIEGPRVRGLRNFWYCFKEAEMRFFISEVVCNFRDFLMITLAFR